MAKRGSVHKVPGGIRELMALALPMVVSMSCDTIMIFTDRLFMAKVASEQMNAVMGGGVALQMLTFFFYGLIGYSTALTAQYYGAGEKSNSTKAAFQAILIVFVAWPVVLLAKPLIIDFFYWMKLPASQVPYQIQFFDIVCWGCVFGLLRHVLGCYFTGIGKTRMVMAANLTAMIVNVALDYVLIFGKLGFPALGIRGAAVATISGAFVSVVILATCYLSRANRMEFAAMKSFRFNGAIMRKLVYYGSPAGLEMFLNFLAFSFMIALFHGQGDVVATASTIMFNWDLVSFVPLLGIEIAVTSLVGRYMGARQPETAHRSAISAIKTGMSFSLAILFLFVFVPGVLVNVFRPHETSRVFEDAFPIAVSMIRIASLYVLSETVMVAMVGALRGAGDTWFTMIASVACHWLSVFILYLSLNVFEYSVPFSWFLLVVFFLLFCCVLVYRFRQGKWKTMRVIG